jgi:hypothetical protein
VVEEAVLPRDVGDEAEDAVAAGRQPGAERREADRGGAGARSGQVAGRAGEPGEGGREVGVRTDQVGTESVDQQDGGPAGAAEGGGEVERVGREVPALHRHPDRRCDARQDVGEGGLAVAGHRQVRR